MQTPHTENSEPRRGIYCLANDGVLEWFIAFIKSLRQHNPTIPLRVIPFDDRCAQLEKLCSIYDFSIIKAPLHGYDAIGELFVPGQAGAHTFRKLHAFEGEFDEFLFLDSDIVVVDDLSPLFAAFGRSDADVLFTDLDVEHVYAAGELYERSLHDPRYKAFNTGIWMARRGLLQLEQLGELARAAHASGQMHHDYDQPFINFCLHETGARLREAREELPHIFERAWAADPDINKCDNIAARFNPEVASNGKWMPFLHWAGYATPPVIPNGKIFLHYRLAGETSLQRALYHSRNNVVFHYIKTGYKRNAGRAQRVLKRLSKRN